MLTSKEAQAMLGVSASNFHSLVRSGAIVSIPTKTATYYDCKVATSYDIKVATSYNFKPL